MWKRTRKRIDKYLCIIGLSSFTPETNATSEITSVAILNDSKITGQEEKKKSWTWSDAATLWPLSVTTTWKTGLMVNIHQPSPCFSVAQWCPTLCNPMDCSMPGLPVFHYLLEFAKTHVHWVSDAIQPSHPLSPRSHPALNLSQHQGLFQW